MKDETKRAVADAIARGGERERQIVARFRAWEGFQKALQDARRTAKERVDAAQARFREAIEAGTQQTQASKAGKLQAVEASWQALEEAKAEKIEDVKAAKDDLQVAESRLREAVENAAQLTLWPSEETGEIEDEDA